MTVDIYASQYSWVPGTFSGQGAACPWDAVSDLENLHIFRVILIIT